MVFVRSICADLDHAKEYDLIGVVSDDDAHMSIVDVSYLAEIRAKGAKWPHHKREEKKKGSCLNLCVLLVALGSAGVHYERHMINQYP